MENEGEKVKPSNSEVEQFILNSLPVTFGALSRNAPLGWYRPIDAGLQRLKRAGKITFYRSGRDCVWIHRSEGEI